MGENARSKATVFTVGHSTLPLQRFLEIFEAHGIELVADVRTVPRSRHNPQFDREVLPGSLRQEGIDYVHLSGLGGFRKPTGEATNDGWRNSAFRGYADYMQTAAFEQELAGMIELATDRTAALMCSEALPWRCHRSLIADALSTRGHSVVHLMGGGGVHPHRLTSFAVVDGERLTYPAAQALDLDIEG